MPFSEVFIRRVLAAISDYSSNKLTYLSRAEAKQLEDIHRI